MLQRKKYIIIIAVLLILLSAVTIINDTKNNSPLYIVRKTTKLKLPISAKVENFTYDKEGDYYKIKILIEENSLKDIKEKLSKVFNNNFVPKREYDRILNYRGTCPWWDLNKENIDLVYRTYLSSQKKLFKFSPDAHQVWAFLTEEKNGVAYLYIAY